MCVSCAWIRRRLTIAQVRAHPWVVAGGNGFPTAMDEDPALPALSFDDLPPLEDDSEEFLYEEVDGFM